MIINMKTILISLSLVGCIISTAAANAFSRTSKRPFSDERHLLTMQPSCKDPKTSTSMLLTQTRPLSEAWKIVRLFQTPLSTQSQIPLTTGPSLLRMLLALLLGRLLPRAIPPMLQRRRLLLLLSRLVSLSRLRFICHTIITIRLISRPCTTPDHARNTPTPSAQTTPYSTS